MQRGYVQHITSKHKRFVLLHIGRRRMKQSGRTSQRLSTDGKLIDRNTKTAVSTLYNLFLFDINPIFFSVSVPTAIQSTFHAHPPNVPTNTLYGSPLNLPR